ncbi:MAG: UDP-N-acetylmuramoyl-tripeptide--D-alanyl-D-alanine ligase [Blastocatellia bacterium]|jgi:UDP-N-acetylmuramoyl-tripeptide--D-alanyl-D-alanine ligase|nr:UDP-N-acetylmuramoyl-tripeptide--D-alanyl-D-alanine ligase [Blastocatellia bacterium]
MGATVDSAAAEFLDKEIKGFSIDSRSVEQGELFFALSQADYERAGFNGSFADAHQFIPRSLEIGAIAAVARQDHAPQGSALAAFSDRLLLVEDAIAALQRLAHEVYAAWNRPVVGITGSAGKTTAKELTAHLLKASGRRVLKSERNYNNGLGLPLAVLQMVTEGRAPEQFDMAVLEMGMSSPTHEIQRLCQITPPDIGVELLVAPVHLEYLGTMENIAAAKAELIEGLKPGGTAVLNADDERVIRMRSKHDGPLLTFGIDNESDVMATRIDTSRFGRSSFLLRTPRGEAPAMLPMTGRHNLMNALAAAAVATCFDIAPEEIASALRTARPPQMRGEVLDFAAGFTVVDDSYNSNPRSLVSMVSAIGETEAEAKRRIVVAGEMLELGPDAARMHRAAGREIAQAGIDILWGVRGLGVELVHGASEAGMNDAQARFFETSEEAAIALAEELREGDLVLVKGSRGVRTDKVVQLLRERFPIVGGEEGE